MVSFENSDKEEALHFTAKCICWFCVVRFFICIGKLSTPNITSPPTPHPLSSHKLKHSYITQRSPSTFYTKGYTEGLRVHRSFPFHLLDHFKTKTHYSKRFTVIGSTKPLRCIRTNHISSPAVKCH